MIISKELDNLQKITNKYYLDGKISKKQAYFLMSFVNNCNPIFILSSDAGKYYKREPWKWDIKTYTIAKKCGFENTTYFNKVFKQLTKTTPTEYRNNHKD